MVIFHSYVSLQVYQRVQLGLHAAFPDLLSALKNPRCDPAKVMHYKSGRKYKLVPDLGPASGIT